MEDAPRLLKFPVRTSRVYVYRNTKMHKTVRFSLSRTTMGTEDRSKGFNIAWIRTILITSYTFEQFQDIQEGLSILHCKTMYCYQKDFTEFFRMSETEKNRVQQWIMVWFKGESVSELADILYSSLLWIRRMVKMTEGKLHATCHKQESAHTKNFETLSKNSILLQFEARSSKKAGIFLTNKIKRGYSLRHTLCRVHWKNDMYEDERSALSQGKEWF